MRTDFQNLEKYVLFKDRKKLTDVLKSTKTQAKKVEKIRKSRHALNEIRSAFENDQIQGVYLFKVNRSI